MSIDGVVHSFETDLNWSADLSDDEKSWVAFYKRLWPDMLFLSRPDRDSKQQRQGIDRVVHFASGKQILIDEKKRRKAWDDILLEEVSVWYADDHPSNKVGWALDDFKTCHYVAYAIPTLSKCYLLPFELTKAAFRANLAEWSQNPLWYPKMANNGTYLTKNCAIPWDKLREVIAQQMHRKFNGSHLELPVPRTENNQMIFDW